MGYWESMAVTLEPVGMRSEEGEKHMKVPYAALSWVSMIVRTQETTNTILKHIGQTIQQ